MMKLIIFDYDGVIMDSFEFSRKIYQDLSNEFDLGIPDDIDYLKNLMELDWRLTLKKLGLTTPEQLKRDEELFKEGLIKYSDMIKPYEGMPEVIRTLSEKYMLAVITNNFKSEFERLKSFGLYRYFKAFYSCEDGELKPSPDMLLSCMKQLKVEPEETAMVGDMDGDIIAGKKAGLAKVIGVTYGYHHHHRLKQADVVIDEPMQLLKVL